MGTCDVVVVVNIPLIPVLLDDDSRGGFQEVGGTPLIPVRVGVGVGSLHN